MGAFEFSLRSCEIDGKRAVEKRGINSSVQQVIDSECLRLMDPYIPFDTGELIDNGVMNTVIGKGKIEYNSPYARNQYYIPMEHAGQKCAYWFEVMKNNGGKEKILNVAKKAAGAK